MQINQTMQQVARHLEFIKCENQNRRPYQLFTIPKSGTHLTEAILRELGYKKWGPPHHFIYDKKNDFKHLPNDKRYIAQIRDPRDILVSLVNHIDKRFAAKLKNGSFSDDPMLTGTKQQMQNWLNNKSFDEKLMDAITCNDKVGYNFSWVIKKQWNEAKRLINTKPFPKKVLVVRFEDLVKSSHSSKQIQTIQKIANHLNIIIDSTQAQKIVDNVWGKSVTFHSGKTQVWKTHFKPEHIAEFKKRWDSFLYLFNYETDKNWEQPFLKEAI